LTPDSGLLHSRVMDTQEVATMPKKAQGSKRRTLVLPAELYERVQAEQERTGAPVAEIMRRALNEYLTPREQAAKKRGL
jgi:hypothetical protein